MKMHLSMFLLKVFLVEIFFFESILGELHINILKNIISDFSYFKNYFLKFVIHLLLFFYLKKIHFKLKSLPKITNKHTPNFLILQNRFKINFCHLRARACVYIYIYILCT